MHLYFSNVCVDLVNDSFTIRKAVDRRQVFNGSDYGVHTFAVAKIKKPPVGSSMEAVTRSECLVRP
jgi:hypothetical protein